MGKVHMEPSLAKRFRTGRVCLNFAHTGGTRDWTEPELISDPAGLERWLAHVVEVDGVQSRPADVAKALRLREAVWGLVRARLAGRELATDDVRTVNVFAAATPPSAQLTDSGSLAPQIVPAAAAFSAVARDAVDLFAGPLGQRIRVCAADDCTLLFVDSSRPGTRRWCSMERCGNLAKIHTHRASIAGRTSAR